MSEEARSSIEIHKTDSFETTIGRCIDYCRLPYNDGGDWMDAAEKSKAEQGELPDGGQVAALVYAGFERCFRYV